MALLACAEPAIAIEACTAQDTPRRQLHGDHSTADVAFQFCPGKCGAVDRDGFWVVPPHYDAVDAFSDGLAPVLVGDAYGYVDRSGSLVIPPRFGDDIQPFSEGLAAVVVGGKWGYMDRTGKLVIEAKFDDPAKFHEGLIASSVGDLFGFFDKSGALVAKVDTKMPFSSLHDGLAMVLHSGEGRYGLVDRSGRWVLPPKYHEIHYNGGNIIPVSVGLKAGVIDRAGKWLVEPQFDEIGYFSEGLAPFRDKKRWGIIDTCGKIVVAARYDEIEPFGNGFAAVQKDGKWGLIDRQGHEVVPPDYDNKTSKVVIGGMIAMVKFHPDRTTVLDVEGRTVVPLRDGFIQPINDDLIIVGTAHGDELWNRAGRKVEPRTR